MTSLCGTTKSGRCTQPGHTQKYLANTDTRHALEEELHSVSTGYNRSRPRCWPDQEKNFRRACAVRLPVKGFNRNCLLQHLRRHKFGLMLSLSDTKGLGHAAGISSGTHSSVKRNQHRMGFVAVCYALQGGRTHSRARLDV